MKNFIYSIFFGCFLITCFIGCSCSNNDCCKNKCPNCDKKCPVPDKTPPVCPPNKDCCPKDGCKPEPKKQPDMVGEFIGNLKIICQENHKNLAKFVLTCGKNHIYQLDFIKHQELVSSACAVDGYLVVVKGVLKDGVISVSEIKERE